MLEGPDIAPPTLQNLGQGRWHRNLKGHLLQAGFRGVGALFGKRIELLKIDQAFFSARINNCCSGRPSRLQKNVKLTCKAS